MVTIEMLKAKIARLQEELAEVSAALDELGGSPSQRESAAATPSEISLDGIEFTDPLALLPAVDAAFVQLGIEINQPVRTPEEVQQSMLLGGIKPEANILSRGIIEAREE